MPMLPFIYTDLGQLLETYTEIMNFLKKYQEMSLLLTGLKFLLTPQMTNGLSSCYHLDKSTFIFRVIRCCFKVLFNFFKEISLSKRYSPRWNAAFCGVTSGGYTVCKCPIKRTPGLYKLRYPMTHLEPCYMYKQRRSLLHVFA